MMRYDLSSINKYEIVFYMFLYYSCLQKLFADSYNIKTYKSAVRPFIDSILVNGIRLFW